MKIGIVGLPQSGKRTLFELLTGTKLPRRSDGQKPVPGVAHLRDTRFESLAALYDPQKRTPAQIELELLPDLDKRMIQEGAVFRDIARLDAICCLVRAFSDSAVYHIEGSVDPARDIDMLTAEFVLHDLLFIEKRLERIALSDKKGKGALYAGEKAVLVQLQEHLERDLPVRTCPLTDEERAVISGYPFITLKQLVIVLNQSEEALETTDLVDSLRSRYEGRRLDIMQISAKLESEIAALDSEEECREFMAASAIEEPAVIRLSRLCMEALSLVSFFTVGKDEVRQWLVPRGSAAPRAAGCIHSDIERGFIRAEVMKHEELLAVGCEQRLKRAGKYHLVGKEYEIEDGDVVSFLFNV